MKKFLIFGHQDAGCHEGCSFEELGNLALPSKTEYCEAHGYDYYLQKKDFDYSKSIGWVKIKILIEKIKENKWDWILYLDVDTMICNHTIRLETLTDDNYDIVIARNFNSENSNPNYYEVNCGVILVKCSDWSLKFFENLYKKTDFHKHVWAEQAAMMDELNNKPETRSHFKFVAHRYFNSSFHQWYPEWNFQQGDFICHAAGSSNNFRYKLFTELKEKIIKAEKVSFKTIPFV